MCCHYFSYMYLLINVFFRWAFNVPYYTCKCIFVKLFVSIYLVEYRNSSVVKVLVSVTSSNRNRALMFILKYNFFLSHFIQNCIFFLYLTDILIIYAIYHHQVIFCLFKKLFQGVMSHLNDAHRNNRWLCKLISETKIRRIFFKNGCISITFIEHDGLWYNWLNFIS